VRHADNGIKEVLKKLLRFEVLTPDISEEAEASDYCLLRAGFLFGLFFDPENRGDMLLLKVSRLKP
jgi:hypothetical protein